MHLLVFGLTPPLKMYHDPWSILESQGYGYLDLELRSRMMLGLLVAWPSLSAGSAVFLARSTRN